MAKRRAGMSNSPLARPDAPVHKLAALVQRYMFFPSPEPLYVVLGAVAGNMLRGSPVWVVLVGPASCGKTLLLDMVHYGKHHHMERSVSVDMIKNASALLSGTPAKEKSKDAKGGWLRQRGSMGILLIKDFTTMMSLSRDNLVEVIGALRRVYDGAWDRSIGSEGGKVLNWEGKAGLLSACTGAIDRHHATIAELGERWIYYRFDESDGYGATMAALKNKDPHDSMVTLYTAVKEFLDEMGIEWTAGLMERRELEDQESDRLYYMGRFVSAARSTVTRDWRTKEVMDVKETEAPTRLAGALTQLYLGMELIGLGDGERWPIMCKVAMDSMPAARKTIINHLRKGASRPGMVKAALGVSTMQTRMLCQDLELHGVVERVNVKNQRLVDEDNKGSWRLTQWSRKCLRMGWGE